MSLYSLFNNLYDPFPMFRDRSVYVVSDSELAKYKRAQAELEILELDRLIEGHRNSIQHLENTRNAIRAELPAAPEATLRGEDTISLG